MHWRKCIPKRWFLKYLLGHLLWISFTLSSLRASPVWPHSGALHLNPLVSEKENEVVHYTLFRRPVECWPSWQLSSFWTVPLDVTLPQQQSHRSDAGRPHFPKSAWDHKPWVWRPLCPAFPSLSVHTWKLRGRCTGYRFHTLVLTRPTNV